MNVDRRTLLAALLAGTAGPVWAQGFAGLGSDADGFSRPDPGYRFSFPADHGPHPGFRIEWWYLTANLRDAAGTDYGIQWTLFRSGLKPGETAGWQSPQLWMGHAALTTPDRHFHAEKIARGGIGQAGVTPVPFEAWIDDWQMAGPDPDRLTLRAHGDGFAYDLRLQAEGPLIFHGQNGYSVKSADGQASHYYSQPHYVLNGVLTLPEGPVEVTGHGWLDREWSSRPLASDQSGWDWFSLTLDTGDKLMAFRLRGARGDFTAATWIDPQGRAVALGNGEITLIPNHFHPVAGREVPTEWSLSLPERQLDVTIRAVNPGAWMDMSVSYWEGPVRITGSHSGRGYLEMTGY